jgi:serine/threonine protein phosphatase 1
MHGRVDLLDQLFWHIALGPRAASATKRFKCSSATTLIGGAASRKVLAIERNRTHQMVFLNGNSETFVFEFLDNPAVLGRTAAVWLETLPSYQLEPRFQSHSPEQIELANTFADLLPESHLQLLRALKPWFICGDFECGRELARSPNQPVRRRSARIRDDFLTADAYCGKLIVHGSTCCGEPDISFNLINIDTGTFAR